ncbi:hypothetical protein O3G_MSEX003580 [Manduca sexta]|uniref:Uncharacterized protein n=1 Tax=Manduca sexta TaxID=7130 RepID=A0A921YS47_MANSE|nr:hypothetical protein O3G_MSEX003580 [Manduca sexta]
MGLPQRFPDNPIGSGPHTAISCDCCKVICPPPGWTSDAALAAASATAARARSGGRCGQRKGAPVHTAPLCPCCQTCMHPAQHNGSSALTCGLRTHRTRANRNTY